MVTLATTHNGGRSQVGFWALQYAEDFPFLNHYKNSSDFSYADTVWGVPDPMELDENGYANTLAHGGYHRLFFIPWQTERPGHYVLKWDGIGTVGGPFAHTVPPSATFTGVVASNVLTVTTTPSNPILKGMTLSTGGRVGDQSSGTAGGSGNYAVIGGTNSASGSKTASSGSWTNTVEGQGRVIFLPVENRIPVGPATMSVKITNIVCCHVDDEARLEAGEIFGVKFMERMREANFGSIRFLDWLAGNTSTIARWSHRRSASYASWAGAELRGSWAVAAPTQAGTTFSCNAPSGFTRANRQVVQFKFGTFTGANDGSVQYYLNVGGTGAKPMRGHQSFRFPTLPAVCSCVWIAELDAYVVQEAGIWGGVPYEICVRLCAELGAHPYFLLPAYAGDADLDTDHWGYGLGSYMKTFKASNGCNWMKEKIEGPNETWNYYAGFITAFVAWACQWMRNSGGRPEPLDKNNMQLSDGFTVSAFTYTGIVGGKHYANMTLSSGDLTAQPLAIGSNIVLGIQMEENGLSGAGYRPFYVTAINVGGNPQQLTGWLPAGAIGGTYDGSGGWVYPHQYDNGNWYGRVLGRTSQRYSAAYADGGAGLDVNYDFIIGVQTGYSQGEGGGGQDDRFTTPHWTLVNGTGERAVDVCSHGAPVNYVNPNDQYTMREVRTAYTRYITHAGNPTLQAADVADYVDSFGDTGGTYVGISGALNVWTNWKNYYMSVGLGGMQAYEGGWSPDYADVAQAWYSTVGPMSVVTGATKEAQCKVTLPRSCQRNQFPGPEHSDLNWNNGDKAIEVGQGCIVGMQLDFMGVAGMTELNAGGSVATGRGQNTLSFPGASTHINWTNGNLPLVGQSISFGATAPYKYWPFSTISYFAMYYVVARNVSPPWIEISATKGGSAISIPETGVGSDVWANAGWRVLAVNDTTNVVTLDCNSTSFGTWAATPADIFSQRAIYDRGDIIMNVLRSASKLCADSPMKPGEGLKGWIRDTYDNWIGLSEPGFRSEYPSMYMFCAPSKESVGREYDGAAWGALTNIYQSPDPPQWNVAKEFNEVEGETVYTAAFRYIR